MSSLLRFITCGMYTPKRDDAQTEKSRGSEPRRPPVLPSTLADYQIRDSDVAVTRSIPSSLAVDSSSPAHLEAPTALQSRPSHEVTRLKTQHTEGDEHELKSDYETASQGHSESGGHLEEPVHYPVVLDGSLSPGFVTAGH